MSLTLQAVHPGSGGKRSMNPENLQVVLAAFTGRLR
jgi:hypothetical protein